LVDPPGGLVAPYTVIARIGAPENPLNGVSLRLGLCGRIRVFY